MRRRVRYSGAAGAALLACLAAAPSWANTSAPPPGTSPKSAAGCVGKVLVSNAAPCQRTIRLRAKILHPKRTNDLDALRKELVLKLDALNQPAPAPAPTSAPALARLDAGEAGRMNRTAGDAGADAGSSRKLCPPSFEMAGWQGSVGFSARLAQLRGRIVGNRAASSSLVALAQFYVAHGLAGEALGVVAEAMPAAGSMSDDAARLQRVADLARLMKGIQIGAASPLLGNPPQCDRPDLGLWQALAAAAAHDPQGVEHAMANDQGAKAQLALQTLPDPVRDILAYRVADTVDDDSPVLPMLAHALRDAAPTTQEDKAASWLLEARLAASHGNAAGEKSFLERAAGTGRSLPGLQAEIRLAVLAARADRPLSARDEARLADAARVYRATALGQGAAAELAERKLRDGDFTASLRIADQSARAGGMQNRADRNGAVLTAKILRVLLVSPGQARLPPPAERAALYLRYQGYATPGPQGDDIRLGAARLLLAQGLPAAALDAARQLSAPAAGSPQGLGVRALAEAQAGDPATALDLIGGAPPDNDMHRAAATALARLARPEEAAHQLDGLTSIADRLRRVRLLSDAKAWGDAASACADLLRDPTLPPDARREASDRYGLAVVLSGGHADPALTLAPNGLAARALAALPAPDAAGDEAKSGHGAITAVRGALRRARAIDGLLQAATPSPGV